MNPVKFGDFTVTSAEFVKAAVSLKGLPEERLPMVAFLGRSNVGKSSLMNALMGQKKLVKVSLPGVGFAKVSNAKRDQMSEFIREYVEKCKDLRGLVYLVDIRHGGTPTDIDTVESIRNTGCPVLVIASKRDKVNQSELAKGLRQIQERLSLPEKPLCVSAVKGHGIATLWQDILSAINGTNIVDGNK